MSAPASPDSSFRKPLPISKDGSPTRQNRLKENEVRKVLPAIPMPPSGRIQGAPLSPVRISVHPDDWQPQASSGKIEEHSASDSEISEDSHLKSADARILVTQELPYRSNHQSNGQISRIPEPEAGIISSVDSPDRRSSNSSLGQQGPKIATPEGTNENGFGDNTQPVPRLQYHHHQTHHSEGGGQNRFQYPGSPPGNDAVEVGASINRHLTPTSLLVRGTPIPRPISAYSDGGRSSGVIRNSTIPSPNFRAPSAGSSLYDNRPLSYIDLANVSYPQAPPPAISLDNSQLRSVVGRNASLLSMNKTLSMYRMNVKKTTDVETQYAFAVFLIQCAQELGPSNDNDSPKPHKSSPKPGRSNSPYIEEPELSPQELIREAKAILTRLADRGYPFAQYYLADGFASGLFSKGKEDYDRAFPLFVSASKHGHAESGYRAALCYEFGWGSKKDLAKAVQFYRQSASKNHPGAMTRLGRACLTGDLGQVQYREGIKWLNRATEAADVQYNAAPYHLGVYYETGDGMDIFKDESYAAVLFTKAADLGHAEASYRLGDAYEHGKLSCPRDPALSVHFYTGAAQRGHPMAMMALCAWYMIGAEPILEKDENEAYEWARQAAELGLTKAEYAVGYFTEMGIGCRRDPLEANVWYVKAAEAGDERARHRLDAIRAAASGGKPMEVAPPRNTKIKKSASENDKVTSEKPDKECVVM
ncbi:hypothetical protein B0O99DRAFT_498447 [Bisporella sp. PMI_857]|nr:hypothetical protein B0O99DRAFT_498447 [Bisporella sp. PMI_857]